MKTQLCWLRLVANPSRRAVMLAEMRGLLLSAAVTFGVLGHSVAAPLEKTELRYQGWTGQVLFPELADDLGYLAPLRLKWVGNTISGPQDIQTVAIGDVDFGGAFYGAIIKLIAAKAPIKAVADTTDRTKTRGRGISSGKTAR